MNEIFSHVIAAMLGGAAFLAVIANIPYSNIYKYNAAIKQCEKELPRNQVCEITAKAVKQ